MKYLHILFMLFPAFLMAQENLVELVEVRTDEGITLMGVSHIQDQTITMIVEVNSVGFGLKKLETISKRIPAGQEVEIIKLIPRPNRQCSYTANFTYKTRQVVESTQISNSRNNPITVPASKQASQTKTKTTSIVDAPVLDDGIVVYSKSGCGRCEYVTNYFEAHGVPFNDLNISTDAAANERMSSALFGSGFKGGTFKTPVVTVNGEVFYNIKDLRTFVKEAADKVKK